MALKPVLDLDDASIPAWKRQSMQRSLRSARARVHARSDRFVAAATRLLREKGSTDFTVQDVVDRSRMSVRTYHAPSGLSASPGRCHARPARGPGADWP